MLAALAACASLGAGCYESPVALDKYQTQAPPASDSALGVPPESSTTTPPPEVPPVTQPPTSTPAATSTAHSSSSTAVDTSNGPLAFPGILPASETQNKVIHIKTNKGEIVFELLPAQGPKAASNFVYLAKRKFYDGLIFHRIVPGFVIQGGDPLGTGTGGPGYKFEDDPVHMPYNEGIVAMANAGPNTNGSQFFIMLADNPLPPSYSIFGRVTKGMDVVKNIVVGDTMTSVTVASK